MRLQPFSGSYARALTVVPIAITMAVALTACDSDSNNGDNPPDATPHSHAPIVFVHGTAGSASQYQTQAMRFSSNGYPDAAISAYEYSTAGELAIGRALTGGLSESLDEHVDAALAQSEADQAYLVCHSLGTAVCGHYLAGDSTRTSKIAGYVALDGATGENCPGEVPCLGVFGDGNPDARLGDTNAHFPNESHVEVATSAASFAAQYEFITGEAPETTDIVAAEDIAQVSGRAVYFPANDGAAGTSLSIWAVDGATGHRNASEPLARFEIGEDGRFGPVELDPGAHYEFHLQRPERSDHHFYRQPILRDSQFVRLNTSPAGSEIEQHTHIDANHVTLVVSRDSEWWTDRDDGSADVLEVGTTSPRRTDQPAVNVLTPAMGNGDIGIHIHDTAENPGETTGGLIEWFDEQPFQTGIDVFMPAAEQPDGTVTLTSTPRGDSGRQQIIAVPNWPSDNHRVTVIFNDFVQD